MATPAERKALLFLSGVILLGASVRVVRAARSGEGSDSATREALAAQLAAVDSAHAATRTKRDTRARRPRAKSSAGSVSAARTRRVPGPDVPSPGGSVPSPGSYPPSPQSPVLSPEFVDIDRATAEELETLPRVGPVLAKRIVDDRARNGPFGSLEEFQRVRGVGPALAESLRARVTFSGTARPSNAVASTRFRSASTSRRSPRRDPRD
jgi:competence protein ComEA